ncbi:hypothetical protein D5687_07135 [Guyparkeria sp. SCN-R1]|nr:hypothetical protein D5687_07135 [Guyparkeria sp. SCN-R1]
MFAQDAPAEDLPIRVVGFARRAHGALCKEAHRKQPDLRIEFRFFAGRQEGRGAFGKDAGPG